MKLMTIEQFRIRVKEFLNEVTLAEWVMEGIDEVCDKAEKYDALMATPEDGSDDMEPEEWGKPINIVPVEEKRLRELEKKEAKFDKIMNARRDAIESAGQLWLSHSTFANEANRIIKEYEKGE